MINSNKTSAVLVCILFSTALVSAEEPEINEEDLVEDFHENIDLDEFKESVNENRDDIPSFVERIVGGERVNLHFEESDITYSAELDGMEIEEINSTSLDDPTLEVDVNESAMEAVMTSEQPFDELKEQLDEGEINYEAHTVTNSVILGVVDTVISLTDRIGFL